MPQIGGKAYDRVFLAESVCLLVFGLVMLTSASGPLGYSLHDDSFFFIKHQFSNGVIPGAILGLITFFTPYRWYQKSALFMLIASIVLLALVFVPGLGTDLGTFAKSWIQIGTFTFQPSEAVKLTFLIYVAAWVSNREKELSKVDAGLLPFLLTLGIISLLMMKQPDLGTLSIIIGSAFAVYFVAGAPLVYLFGLGSMGLGVFLVAVRTSTYRLERVLTFLHPELDPTGSGYQVNQGLLAIGSGGLFGRGYGHSLQKHQYLPEVSGDSIFAVIGEELGFVMTSLFVVLLLMFVLRGLKIAGAAEDNFGRYLVIGIMAWFGLQILFNVGAMLSILPLTGVPLPLISYGGSSLMMTMAAIGVVLNVSKGDKKYDR